MPVGVVYASMNEFTDPELRFSVRVPAAVEAVWAAWTTPSGVRSWFAPACRVRLAPLAPYEMFFRPDAPTGVRGGEDNVVLAFVPGEFLSFTWNAPPEQAAQRPHRTVVTVRFESVGDDETRVTLTHLGWPPGAEWDETRTYFESAWGDVVLPRLVERFESGPVDWEARERETAAR